MEVAGGVDKYLRGDFLRNPDRVSDPYERSGAPGGYPYGDRDRDRDRGNVQIYHIYSAARQGFPLDRMTSTN